MKTKVILAAICHTKTNKEVTVIKKGTDKKGTLTISYEMGVSTVSVVTLYPNKHNTLNKAFNDYDEINAFYFLESYNLLNSRSF